MYSELDAFSVNDITLLTDHSLPFRKNLIEKMVFRKI